MNLKSTVALVPSRVEYIEKGSRFDQQGAIEGYIWERVEVFVCWPQFKRRSWKDNKVNRKWWMLVATLTITGSFIKVPSQQNLVISVTRELNPSSSIKSHDHVPWACHILWSGEWIFLVLLWTWNSCCSILRHVESCNPFSWLNFANGQLLVVGSRFSGGKSESRVTFRD